MFRTFVFLCVSALSFAQTTPWIQIIRVSPFGVWPGTISGRVLGVSPASYKVAALVFVSGLGFYTKPYCDTTTTALGPDGSFNILLTTGGIDQYATYIAVVAVPAAATVPCYLAEPGVPAALEPPQAVAKVLLPRPNPSQRKIDFAGEKWIVKWSPAPVGPGLNNFSDSADNVWVDAQDRLHLRITKRNGTWYCAEVISERAIGYGRYSFQLDTPPQLDRNAVFGGFTWADAERANREIDMLEVGRFGNGSDPNNAQNVVQPFSAPGNQMRFVLPQIAPTVHELTWLPGAARFRSSDQAGVLLHQWTHSNPPDASSNRLNFRFNLWLFGGAPPSDGNEAEVIVSRYSFQPAIPPRIKSLSPFSGTGLTQTFTAVYSSGIASAPIRTAEAIFNPRPDSGCRIVFNREANLFTLSGDDGSSATGMPGQAGTISNSQCSLNLAGSSATAFGEDLTLVLPLTFTSSYATSPPCTSPGKCPKHIWLKATDLDNRTSNWLVYGVWNPNPAPVSAIPWYRFFDGLDVPNSYVYTFDKNEYDFWSTHGMRGDGISGLVLDMPATIAGTADMAWYRVYVVPTKSHFWTSDRNEYLTLIQSQDTYVSEGVAAFVMPYLDDLGIFHDGVRGPAPVPTSIPFWRSAYNGMNLHFWSPGQTEVPPGYFQEGIACYIFPTSGARLNSEPDPPVAARNAASRRVGPVAPGELLEISGSHLRETVLVNGVPAQVVSADENDLLAIVPAEVSGTEAIVEIGDSRMTLPLVRANPALFTVGPWGKGNARALNDDGSENTADRPAARGSTVTLYATGGGDLPVTAHIGGYPAEVISTAISGTRAGVVEVRVRVPEEVASGPFQPVVLDFGNVSSQPGVGVAVK